MSEIDELVNAKLKVMLSDHADVLEELQQLHMTVKEKSGEVVNLVEAMKKSVITVPEELDSLLNLKVNKILDIVSEVDNKSDYLERLLRKEVPRLLENHSETVNRNSKPSYLSIYMIGFLGGFSGCLIGVLIVVIYFMSS